MIRFTSCRSGSMSRWPGSLDSCGAGPSSYPISGRERSRRSCRFRAPRFGTVICYEVIFPDLFRRGVIAVGAAFMANVTNDAWFGETSGPWQHLGTVPLRAVETRVAIARAANTGVSAFVDPSGRVRRALRLGERGVLADRAAASSPRDALRAVGRLVRVRVSGAGRERRPASPFPEVARAQRAEAGRGGRGAATR